MKILITGARSGIGLNTGLILARMNHEVYLTTENISQQDALSEKIEKLGLNNVHVFKLDVTSIEDRNKIKDLNLDVLINNAAIGVGGSLTDIKVSDVRKNFEVNFFSTLELTKIFLNTYEKGNIVVVSSLAGIMPVPFIGSYAASKAALLMFYTILHEELILKGSKIRIKLIEPGLYKTGFNQVILNENRSVVNNNEYSKELLDFEDAIISFLEVSRTESIAKKIAKAATSKSIRLKYRAPLYQTLGAKIYMLLFK